MKHGVYIYVFGNKERNDFCRL